MKKIRLGKTDVMVSEVGFGGIPIIPLNLEDAIKVVCHGYDMGITFFDTANMYGDSEKKIGQALEPVRDNVILATKTLKRDAEGAAKHIAYSLDNLRTDRIDIYQLHSLSDEKTLEQVLASGGAYNAVSKAQSEGKIRFIGFSSHDIATSLKACRTGFFSTIQFPFNFIERDPAYELFRVAREQNMGIIAMKPLGGGLLERADLCFKFLQQYEDVVPIPGFSSIEEIDEIIELYLSPETLTRDDNIEIEKIRSELGKTFCHRCGYCVPCEQEVKIPEVLSFRSNSKRLAPDIVIMMGKDPMESAENCDECGECLEKCPYKLPIPEVLRENLSAYKEFVAQHS